MVSQCTKFEVSRFTRYDAMIGGAKCTNWGSLGQLGVTQGHRQCHHRQSAYDFLFDFNRNHASVLYLFRDIAGYLQKVANFDPPHLHLAPPQGDSGRISRRSLSSENQSPWIIVWCCLCDPVFSHFSRTLTCDGRAGIRMDTGPWLVPRMQSIAR